MQPQVNYVVDNKGKPIFKARLKTVFKEIRQIQKGEKQGTSLTDFLNEI